jgi:hypothetical protein
MMNERIKELAIKSGAFCEDEFGRLISWGIEGTDLTDEVQKFAELIVKECIVVIGNAFWSSDIEKAIDVLEKHFGVE